MEKTENSHLKKNIPRTQKISTDYRKKVMRNLASSIIDIMVLKSVGLRFFTVYGEWGRPDMMMIKYISAFFSNKKFVLNNFGNHIRDFTYVGDVVNFIHVTKKE